MSGEFLLVLIVAGSYLAAHWAFEWLGHRFMLISGAEYLVLGILLGPQVSGVLQASVLDAFAPFMTLALGWIGAVVGSNFYLPLLVRVRGELYRVAFAEAALTLAVTAALLTAGLAWLYQLPLGDTIPPAAALGAIAVASSPAGVAMLTRRLVRRGLVVRQIEVATGVDAFTAIVTFGLLLCIAHAAPPASVRAPTPTEWAVISVAIGCVGGALFHLFVGNERNIDRLFISIAGAVILVSGAAAYLRLSPLLPAMLIGAMLANTRKNREEIRQALTRVERPLYFVLLIFAGAAWDPGTTGWWMIPAILFVVVRTFAKLTSARLAAFFNGLLAALGARWGRALLGQGGLAIAIALDYHLFHGDLLLPDVVFSAAVTSVLLTDLSSARLVHSVVRRYTRRAFDAPTPIEPHPAFVPDEK
jgi:Kef-type K+ transport system membrane component KefB